MAYVKDDYAAGQSGVTITIKTGFGGTKYLGRGEFGASSKEIAGAMKEVAGFVANNLNPRVFPGKVQIRGAKPYGTNTYYCTMDIRL
jgi:hypothetical protein